VLVLDSAAEDDAGKEKVCYSAGWSAIVEERLTRTWLEKGGIRKRHRSRSDSGYFRFVQGLRRPREYNIQ